MKLTVMTASVNCKPANNVHNMHMRHDTASAPEGTQSIRRAISLLREAAEKAPGGSWRLSELAARCGIDRTTAHRILKCLVAERLIMRSPDGQRYRLGPLAFELGLAAQPIIDLRSLCSDALTRLADRCGDTVFLIVRSGLDAVCMDRREGHYPIKALTVEIGTRRPLCASAGGLAMLMLLPKEVRRRVIVENARRLATTTRLGVRTLTTMLDESMAVGYGLSHDRIIPGVVAIGVPIRDFRHEPLAALSVTAISERLGTTRRPEIVALLRAEAAAIERALQKHDTRQTRSG